MYRKLTWCSIVFAGEHGGAEGQETGWLDALADAASAQQESQEQDNHEEDQSIEAPQELQEGEKVAHDCEEGERAPQGCVEVGETPGHSNEEDMPRQNSGPIQPCHNCL